MIASGDLVALRLVVSGTHTGNLLGVPATGRRIQLGRRRHLRVTDDGRISEQWAFEDLAAISARRARSRSRGRLTRRHDSGKGHA